MTAPQKKPVGGATRTLPLIELGSTCEDSVSGVSGICVARTEWKNGCWRYTLQPRRGKDGKLPDTATFDEADLIVTKAAPKGPVLGG